MKISVSRQAKKDIKSLNEPLKSRIINAIDELPNGDVKSIEGEDGFFRLRVGGYRVTFEKVSHNEITVWGIAPRGQIYKRGFRK